MGHDEGLKLLGGVPLFEGLTDKELRSIHAAGKEVDHAAGSTMVAEGDEGLGFHLILDGQASVTVGGAKRASLGPGDYFGEMSLIDGGPRSATVTADTPVRALAITSWAFTPILNKNPEIARKMLLELSRRLRDLEKSLSH